MFARIHVYKHHSILVKVLYCQKYDNDSEFHILFSNLVLFKTDIGKNGGWSKVQPNEAKLAPFEGIGYYLKNVTQNKTQNAL